MKNKKYIFSKLRDTITIDKLELIESYNMMSIYEFGSAECMDNLNAESASFKSIQYWIYKKSKTQECSRNVRQEIVECLYMIQEGGVFQYL